MRDRYLEQIAYIYHVELFAVKRVIFLCTSAHSEWHRMMEHTDGYHTELDSEFGMKEPFLSETLFVRGDDQEKGIVSRSSQDSRSHLRGALIILGIMNAILLASHAPELLPLLSHTTSLPRLFSPAEPLASTTILRKFNPAFGVGGKEAIYVQEPSAEVDDAWQALYYPTQVIGEEQARHLPNKTVPVSAEPKAGYLIGLSVFHDLHCLDSVRKALWAGTGITNRAMRRHLNPHGDVHNTYEDEHHDIKHLMHCIDNLRQSLMCHVDTTSVSWQWSAAEQGLRVFSDVTHRCRDFDSVLQWGREHAWRGTIDVEGWEKGRPQEVGKCGATDEGCGWR